MAASVRNLADVHDAIAKALALDDSSNAKDAFFLYLQTIRGITDLLQSVADKGVKEFNPHKDSVNLYTIARQALSRSQVLLETKLFAPRVASSSSSPSSSKGPVRAHSSSRPGSAASGASTPKTPARITPMTLLTTPGSQNRGRPVIGTPSSATPSKRPPSASGPRTPLPLSASKQPSHHIDSFASSMSSILEPSPAPPGDPSANSFATAVWSMIQRQSQSGTPMKPHTIKHIAKKTASTIAKRVDFIMSVSGEKREEDEDHEISGELDSDSDSDEEASKPKKSSSLLMNRSTINGKKSSPPSAALRKTAENSRLTPMEISNGAKKVQEIRSVTEVINEKVSRFKRNCDKIFSSHDRWSLFIEEHFHYSSMSVDFQYADSAWASKTAHMPEDAEFVQEYIERIAENSAHSLCRLLKSFAAEFHTSTNEILQKAFMGQLPDHSSLDMLFSDARNFVRKLHEYFLALHRDLKSSQLTIQYLYLALESVVFGRIYSEFFDCYKEANLARDAKLSTTIRSLLAHSTAVSPSVFARHDNSVPSSFIAAVDELSRLPSLHCPTHKIQCLIRTMEHVYSTIPEFLVSPGSVHIMQACSSEAAPVVAQVVLLSSVIVDSKIPALWSEIAFIEDSLDEIALESEQGQILAELNTAIDWISNMEAASAAAAPMYSPR